MSPAARCLWKVTAIMLPYWLIAVSYFVFDPFKVLYTYENYYAGMGVTLNRDFASTETLLRELPRRGYDSFILGSSRSMAFLCSDWAEHVDSTALFHFDASDEQLYGIERKVAMLDARNVPIRHALVVVDRRTLEGACERTGHLFVKHRLLSGQSAVEFQLTFLKAYLSKPVPFLWYKARGTPPSSRGLIDRRSYDPVTNDCLFTAEEQLRSADVEAFYQKRAAVFVRKEVPGGVSDPVCGPEQVRLLREIRRVFEKHGTRYQIVVSPRYDQQCLHPDDLCQLRAIFGADRVHDFSGVNEFTCDVHNYYEDSHFRPTVGRAIMSRIYGPANSVAR